MKKICSTICVVLLLTTASLFAQPKKGSVILGGDFGIDYINNSNSQNELGGELFTVSILPEFGFFTNDKVAIGFHAGFQYGKSSYYDTVFYYIPPFYNYVITESEAKEKYIILQPFISTFHFFSDRAGIKNYFYASVAFGSGVQMMGYPFISNSVLRLTTGYELKFLFFLKESVALNLGLIGLQYMHEAVKIEETDITYKTNRLQLNSPFKNSLSVGLEFYLIPKSPEKK